jgi:hypothetical protein
LQKQHNNQPKTVPAMGRVFETRFGRGRTFGEDDYPSFWTAIRATKNIKQIQADRGFATRWGSLFFWGGKGAGVFAKKVSLRGLRISEKKSSAS